MEVNVGAVLGGVLGGIAIFAIFLYILCSSASQTESSVPDQSRTRRRVLEEEQLAPARHAEGLEVSELRHVTIAVGGAASSEPIHRQEFERRHVPEAGDNDGISVLSEVLPPYEEHSSSVKLPLYRE